MRSLAGREHSKPLVSKTLAGGARQAVILKAPEDSDVIIHHSSAPVNLTGFAKDTGNLLALEEQKK